LVTFRHAIADLGHRLPISFTGHTVRAEDSGVVHLDSDLGTTSWETVVSEDGASVDLFAPAGVSPDQGALFIVGLLFDEPAEKSVQAASLGPTEIGCRAPYGHSRSSVR
jgi:hypothetical protein